MSDLRYVHSRERTHTSPGAVRKPHDDSEVQQHPVLLLGAGASAEAGVPISHAMTEALVAAVGRTPRARVQGLSQALNFVCGALIAYDSAAGADPYRGLDVERVFAAVRLLAERRHLEISPFVGAWHPGVETWDRPPRRTPPGFDRRLREAVTGGRGRPSDEIARLVSALTGTGTGRTYELLAQQLLGELRRLLAVTPKEVKYLDSLRELAALAGGLTVATLNYDLSVELAASDAVDTGIVSWIQSGSWQWRTEALRLLKLHGSIDWSWQSVELHSGLLPERVVAISSDATDDKRLPAIVFGQREKLRAEGPFLSLLAEFEQQLAVADKLVAIGYSFRDAHINEIVRRWLNGGGQRRVTIVDPHLPERLPRDDFRQLMLSHLDGRAEVWRAPASDALKKLKVAAGL